MIQKPQSINLVRTHKSFFERFISWSLTFGRVVVIATEGIALSAFLFRFSLDRQIIDLHDQIKQKQAIIAYLKNNETIYRDVQDRLKEITTLSAKAPPSLQIFSDIVAIVPQGIKFSNFTINNDSIKIEADANTINALSSFIQTLKANKKISSVSLDRIENKSTSSTIAFGLSIQLQK